MTTKVIKKFIDFGELDKAIAIKESQIGEFKDIYIIMSDETFDTIKAECCLWNIKNNDMHYGTYKGNPIAVCNMIPYGEVELR